MSYHPETLIDVSPGALLLAVVPLIAIACSSWYLDIGIHNPLLVATIRTFVQLSILSFILEIIFVRGDQLWGLVLGYVLFMVTLAAYESTSRSKYYFRYMFWCVMAVILVNIAITSLFAFALIFHLDPLWDPQYVIPVIGMLLGNCINGVSLSLNAMLTSVIESSREIELLLSFGANSYEASSRLLKEAIRTGSMPQLSSMAIIGLISIPGMMTGQILGGSTVTQAAQYQILIMYLIAFCCFGSILAEILFTVRVCFDSRTMLRVDRLEKSVERKSLLPSVVSFFSNLVGYQKRGDSSSAVVPASSDEASFLAPQGELTVSTSRLVKPKVNNRESAALKVSNLSYSFKRETDKDQRNMRSNIYRRVLFQNINFRLEECERSLVDGPSGVGKSTLLRIIAGLTPPEDGEIFLCGRAQSSFEDMTIWRKQVLYVPQTKIDFPGSPMSLLKKITSFQVWKREIMNLPSISNMIKDVKELIHGWGMDLVKLYSEWKILSGGESQRILLGIALASRPKVILLDESTSALDLATKVKVEKSIETYSTMHKMSVIWITHDQSQQGRMQMKNQNQPSNGSS